MHCADHSRKYAGYPIADNGYIYINKENCTYGLSKDGDKIASQYGRSFLKVSEVGVVCYIIKPPFQMIDETGMTVLGSAEGYLAKVNKDEVKDLLKKYGTTAYKPSLLDVETVFIIGGDEYPEPSNTAVAPSTGQETAIEKGDDSLLYDYWMKRASGVPAWEEDDNEYKTIVEDCI